MSYETGFAKSNFRPGRAQIILASGEILVRPYVTKSSWIIIGWSENLGLQMKGQTEWACSSEVPSSNSRIQSDPSRGSNAYLVKKQYPSVGLQNLLDAPSRTDKGRFFAWYRTFKIPSPHLVSHPKMWSNTNFHVVKMKIEHAVRL